MNNLTSCGGVPTPKVNEDHAPSSPSLNDSCQRFEYSNCSHERKEGLATIIGNKDGENVTELANHTYQAWLALITKDFVVMSHQTTSID